MTVNNEAYRILVLAPHTDDGELGCGAAITKFLDEGREVYYMAFSTCEESVPAGLPKDILKHEVQAATKVLGLPRENLIIKNYQVRKFPQYRQEILEDLVRMEREIKPDLVFTPSSFDVHQDHHTIFEEARRAYKNQCLLGYEFMWNNYSFNTTSFCVVDEKHIQAKIDAVGKYESQKHRFYARDELIRGLAHYRGLQISEQYAEAFEVIRWIIR